MMNNDAKELFFLIKKIEKNISNQEIRKFIIEKTMKKYGSEVIAEMMEHTATLTMKETL
ncbi:hypothetical protein [Photobacterium indicum]|uniref:hypothetical protein n=1 Tax=Photobacterium indicum TaxID=81447 RepID=UPI0014734A95|nr:hypothetical protein [Photobacterium indicum]